MAQILKEEMRNSIIKAAKKELLDHGYRDASMRRIATLSNMTVGNLYRYFDSKDSLIQTIVSPTLKEIENSISNSANFDITFDNLNFDFELNIETLDNIFDNIADALVDIYFAHQEEMEILMMHSMINDDILGWFSKLISYFISKKNHFKLLKEEIDLLGKSLSVSIFSGVSECLKNTILSKERLKWVVRSYFRSFTSILIFDNNY